MNLLTTRGSGGHAQGDTFLSFENVIGSAFNDTVTAGNWLSRNTFRGNEGDDFLSGLMGATLYGAVWVTMFCLAVTMMICCMAARGMIRWMGVLVLIRCMAARGMIGWSVVSELIGCMVVMAMMCCLDICRMFRLVRLLRTR